MHFLVSARANCEPKRRYHRFSGGTIVTSLIYAMNEQMVSRRIATCIMTRKTIVTHKERIEMEPQEARKGDTICLPLGCPLPVILHERGKGGYELVGEAHMAKYYAR